MAAEVAVETAEHALRAGHDRHVASPRLHAGRDRHAAVEEVPERRPQPVVGLRHHSSNQSVLESAHPRYRSQEAQGEVSVASLQHRSQQLEHDVRAENLKSEQAFLTASLREQSSLRERLTVALGEAEEAAKEARQIQINVEKKAAERAVEVAAAQAAARRAAEHAKSLEADLRSLRREAEAVPEGPSSDSAEAVTQKIQSSKLLDCESWVELSCLRAEARLLREELQESEKTMKVRMEAKDILGPALAASRVAVDGLKEHTNQLQKIFDKEQFPDADVVALTWKFVRALEAASAKWSMARLGAGSEKALKVKFAVSDDKTWPAILAAADSAAARVAALQQQVKHQSA
eukprot:TRINITY_DN46732_c0_g1_i1.p1 TRINITY_DN46732_c0_g1~~TRINITY_DN46732_c0_g1_i1.p1  ORF type:complete len:400 (-),score=113.81 TRINITY_DN46732_c0_g1_i1:226-1269(-)